MWKKSLNKFLNSGKKFMWVDITIMFLFIPLNTLVTLWKSNPFHHWISVGIWTVYLVWFLLKRDFRKYPEKYKSEELTHEDEIKN